MIQFTAASFRNSLCTQKGTPILQEILHDCHYRFEWPTNVICPTHDCIFREKTCEVYNDQMDKALDLKQIFNDGILKVGFTSS